MSIEQEHPNFRGNPKDLEAFMRLASSPIRSAEREQALLEWEQYKYQRQVRAALPKNQVLRKGPHMRALTANVIDLTGASLDEICIGYADFRGVIFDHCSLRGAWLKGSRFENASFAHADLTTKPDGGRGAARLLYADLRGADMSHANLEGVDLSDVLLNGANLTDTNLSRANLTRASLVGTTVEATRLDGALIYGSSAWDMQGTPGSQQNLVITPIDSALITVDNLEVAQFSYLLFHNEKIRDVIDTITSKAVLILGRFTPERKAVLNALREELRKRNYTPILFDFDKPSSRDLTETVMTLASLARFVIADLSDPNSIPHEVMSFTRQLLSVPVQAIFCPVPEHKNEYPMYRDLQRLPHVLPVYRNENQEQLISVLSEAVIQPAEDKVMQLRSTT
jgi:hypothetical protein